VDADESPLVRELARRHPNLRPAFVNGDLGPLLRGFDARFAAGSPPPRNPCNELWIAEARRRAAADGIATILTGSRGNAFFSGDDLFWLGALLLRGRPGEFGREVAALAAANGVPAAGRQLAAQLLPHDLHRMRRRLNARRAGLGATVDLRFAGPGTVAIVRRHASATEQMPPRARRAAMARAVSLSGFISEAAAVRDALMGVRGTDPTGDLRVIELCATQPPWARRRGGRTRVVVRDAMADRLPPSIAERTRRGAQLPDWFDRLTDRRGELEEEFTAAREHETCRELLDLDGIGAALRDWPSRGRAQASWTRTTHVYRYNLLRALLMSRYLRFFEAHRGG
jgi:asparagine synthase (glutamine-hydrolysing)